MDLICVRLHFDEISDVRHKLLITRKSGNNLSHACSSFNAALIQIYTFTPGKSTGANGGQRERVVERDSHSFFLFIHSHLPLVLYAIFIAVIAIYRYTMQGLMKNNMSINSL